MYDVKRLYRICPKKPHPFENCLEKYDEDIGSPLTVTNLTFSRNNSYYSGTLGID